MEPEFAFPVSGVHDNEYGHGRSNGMELRDYFAAQALAGLCSETSETEFECGSWSTDGTPGLKQGFIANVAKAAYQVADAMLAARKQN